MANGWTAERKAKQAEMIRQWQPWKQSTGPLTIEGKGNSSLNAFKHGLRSAEWLAETKRVNEVIRMCKQCEPII